MGKHLPINTHDIFRGKLIEEDFPEGLHMRFLPPNGQIQFVYHGDCKLGEIRNYVHRTYGVCWKWVPMIGHTIWVDDCGCLFFTADMCGKYIMRSYGRED